jgi:cell wall-associated NlpC family hydrolase
VNVAVATLWTSPSAPRRVDAKALSAPVDIRGWLAAMSTATRKGLVGRVETQALYGDKLIVTAVRSSWLHVVTPGQATHRDQRGYPGWVPTRQVTTVAPLSATSTATVIRPTSWLRTAAGARVTEISFGTRLPVVSKTSSLVTVATPVHRRLVVAATDVVVRTPAAAALARTRSSVLASARTFLGRPYLWGGRSGFAVDCSGLTSLVYAVHGVVLPRDTDDQATAGRGASLRSLLPADLVFFRSNGAIVHVGFFVSPGRMLDAPHTGAFTRIEPIGSPALARRFL